MLLIIFLINIVNAQTLVAGKVYTSGYNDPVSEADVTVTCNSNSLKTNSLEDGTYAVRFKEDYCNIDNSVEVSAVKGDLSGSGSGVIIECDGSNNCDSGYVSIINLAIKAKQTTENSGSSSRSGGSRGYYYCGNNKCDSGESAATCPKDCSPFINQNVTSAQNTNNTETNPNGNSDNEETQIEDTETNSNQGSISRITGAVIGALGTGWIIVIIFIFGVLVFALIVKLIRNRKEIINSIKQD